MQCVHMWIMMFTEGGLVAVFTQEDNNVYSLSSRRENATSNVEQYIRRLSLMS